MISLRGRTEQPEPSSYGEAFGELWFCLLELWGIERLQWAIDR